jgi:hypothetical protein
VDRDPGTQRVCCLRQASEMEGCRKLRTSCLEKPPRTVSGEGESSGCGEVLVVSETNLRLLV